MIYLPVGGNISFLDPAPKDIINNLKIPESESLDPKIRFCKGERNVVTIVFDTTKPYFRCFVLNPYLFTIGSVYEAKRMFSISQQKSWGSDDINTDSSSGILHLVTFILYRKMLYSVST
jgi:hypothetical protein